MTTTGTLATWQARAKVVASNAVTWLLIISAVLQEVAAELANAGFDDGWTETVSSWLLRIVTWIAGAVLVIRRVSPAPVAERGLLEQ